MLSTFHDPLVALHEVTLNLLQEDNPDSLLQVILDQAIEYTKADTGSIALLDSNRDFLEIKAFRGLEHDVPEKVRLKLGEGVTGRCILTGKTRNVGNVSLDPHYVEIKSDISSELAVPLKLGKKTFGVISVDSYRLDAFNKEHVEYLELLASYAAQIFSNQQVIFNLTHRTRIQNILLELWPVISKHPKIEPVFKEIISLLKEKMGLSRAAIHLYDKVAKELYIIAHANYTDEEAKRGRYKKGEGITGSVFSSGKAISISDTSKDQGFINKSGRKDIGEKVSFFASPIILNGEVQGVFSMELPYTSESTFEDFTFLVQILSTLFSQAIQIQTLIDQSSHEVKVENITLKRQLLNKYGFTNIIGSAPSMKELFSKMRMAADSHSSVLLIGESGTGKELIATALHQNSLRKNNHIVRINCAAIPADLLESELFGFLKGAFTGANEDKKGKFLLAHKGTVFLDEIAEMDMRLQAKLLRFLQEKEFSPLGGNQVYNVDVRIIAATNKDLEELVAENKFREDLYYRLNVIKFEIPPLRERLADLPLLCNHLIDKISTANKKKINGITTEALQKLEQYSYPGNVRELENILERAIVLTHNRSLEAGDIQLPTEKPRPQTEEPVATPQPQQPQAAQSFDLKSWMKNLLNQAQPGEYRNAVISQIERELILYVLQKNLFNKSKTAKMLGINRLTLDRKIQEYDILSEITGS